MNIVESQIFEYFPNGGRNFKGFGSVPDKILEGLKQIKQYDSYRYNNVP